MTPTIRLSRAIAGRVGSDSARRSVARALLAVLSATLLSACTNAPAQAADVPSASLRILEPDRRHVEWPDTAMGIVCATEDGRIAPHPVHAATPAAVDVAVRAGLPAAPVIRLQLDVLAQADDALTTPSAEVRLRLSPTRTFAPAGLARTSPWHDVSAAPRPMARLSATATPNWRPSPAAAGHVPIGLASYNTLRRQTAFGSDPPEVRQGEDLSARFNQLRADDFHRPESAVRAVLYEDEAVPLEPHP